MIIWLKRELVLAIHDRQLAEHAGSSGVRDDNMLESALARPQQLYAYGDPLPDIADLAASLAFGLARNHPFVDGNKRTAAVCCETFIELNGAQLNAEDAELFPLFLALAEGKLPAEELAAWLRSHIQTTKPDSVQEPHASYAGNTLARSNPYMQDPEQRERLVFRSVATSSAIEGIRAPFRSKSVIVGKAKRPKLSSAEPPSQAPAASAQSPPKKSL